MKDARVAHEEARELLDRGIDPSEYKKILKATKVHIKNTSFEGVALNGGKNRHSKTVMHSLDKDVFPQLGRMRLSWFKNNFFTHAK